MNSDEESMMTHTRPRIVLAVATEDSDSTRFIWDRLEIIQPEMFAVGDLAVKFAYFGREGDLEARPFIATNWPRALATCRTSWNVPVPGVSAAALSISATSSRTPWRKRERARCRR